MQRRDVPGDIRIGTSTNFVQQWHDLAAQDVQNRLWYGEPACGWEGDQNLLLTRDENGWVLIHLDNNDHNWYVVCREAKGAAPGALQMLPLALVTMDNFRKDVDHERTKANEVHKAAKLVADADALMEPSERVYHALRKDVGYHHGITSKQFFAFGGLKQK
jgi:hypothetical protein